ncbi:MAG TPA: hypothetical protein VGR90_05815, partial [Acidimicrobiales bacterium]|nr:hypothetical protein [Acidimicrobiales bacterium]
MRPAVQERGWDPWQPMFAARAVLTVAEGIGSRFHQVVSPRGAARTWPWRAAAGAGAVVDLAKAVWFGGDKRLRLPTRLALDAADLALWCLAAEDDADTSEDAVIPGVALAAGAGARLGPGGLVVPAVNAAVAAAVRSRRGHQLRLEQFSWQVMGVVGGWCVRMLAARRRDRLERQQDLENEARTQRAELAGFHDLIVEHEGAVDLLQRANALIELSAPGGRRLSFEGTVKAAAAEAARGQATYLADALAAWERRHNLRRELAGVVLLQLAEGAGTQLLSHAQVTALHGALDALPLGGTVAVDVVRAQPEDPPFMERRLTVGQWPVRLPGEGAPRRWVFDATPVAFLLDLGWLSQPTGAQREAVPWKATIGPLAATVGAALWSARREDANRSIPPLASVAASGAITLVYTAAATRTMRNPHTDDGVSRFPWVMALQGYELVRGINTEEAPPAARALGWAAMAAIVATGWRLSPPP